MVETNVFQVKGLTLVLFLSNARELCFTRVSVGVIFNVEIMI